MRRPAIFFVSWMLFGGSLAAPSDSSFVVSSTESSINGDKDTAKEGTTSDNVPHHPVISEMVITSNVSNRFAKTLVASKVKNAEKAAKETTFTVVLPEKAFISEFVMEVGGKSYKAYVREKEEAKQIYNQAVASGQSAGHVAVSARDSNKFTVSVNVEPESKVTFLLTYEELLERKNNQYELVLNIRPGQIIKKLNVKVQINETRPLKFVRTPSLRSGNEISKNDDRLDPSSDVQIINSTTAVVKFSPDAEKQRQFARDLGDKESDGLSGQFIVQYDVERDASGGEVLLQDGYFVHFFAPKDLEPLPKHVIFVLDSSGSMSGTKFDQLKDAMNNIVNETREGDLISVLDFSHDANIWNIEQENLTQTLYGVGFRDDPEDYRRPFEKLSKLKLPIPSIMNKETLKKVKRITDTVWASGGTNIVAGLVTGLYLAKAVQDRDTQKKFQPIMIFLTDGEPNTGISSSDEITKLVSRLNSENNDVPIFTLSFGNDANKDFLRKLSLNNLGFSRHIYEAADASLQLQEFYKQISSPLLSNITFKYTDQVSNVSKTTYPIYFSGSEIVVTGQYEEQGEQDILLPVECWELEGPKQLTPTVQRPVTSLERLWAYLTIKQILDERELSDEKKELTKKALDLALEYSFVTEVTSLVVVKPNETSSVNTEDASSDTRDAILSYKSPALFITPQQPALYNPSYSAVHSASAQSSYVPYSAPLAVNYDTSPIENRAFVAAIPESADNFGTVFYDYDDMDSLSSSAVSSTTTPTAPTHIPKLQNNLPWLAQALNSNGTLTIQQNVYELGEFHNVTVPQECTKTPISTQPGQCVLLKDCSEVFSYLTDFQTYQQYFCPIDDNFAGICCPKKITL